MYKTIFSLLFLIFSLSLFAQNQNIPQQLDRYLKDHLTQLQLQSSDLRYTVSSHYASTHTGVEHIYLQQQYMGLPIRGAVLNTNLSAEGEVLSIGNRFVDGIEQRAISAEPTVAVREALGYVLSMFGPQIAGRSIRPAEVQSIKLLDQDGYRHRFAPSGLALEPIELWQEWMVQDDKLMLVWAAEYHSLDAQHVWLIRINPYELELVDYQDQVLHCQFSCAENHEHKTANGEAEYFPRLHSSAEANRTSAGSQQNEQAEAPTLLDSPTPNSYFVFPFPVESPNHGVPEVIVDPADLGASPFGWHDTNAVVGPEFTTTRGNNVHAYHDIFRLRRSLNDDPDGGTELCFDYPYTPGLRPHQQVDAAITNLFFWNNFAHDVLYYYGFDEAAGNFQATNYTGVPDSQANDWVRAEALDGGGLNNANFFTPPDGGRGRMQMFIWNSSLPTSHRFTMQIDGPDSLAGIYGYRPALFGPLLLPEDDLLQLPLVVAEDTTDIPGDACDSLLNPGDLAGKAALIERSDECSNFTKALNAQAAGAALVVICNSAEGDDFYTPSSAFFDDSLTIPVIGLSRAICDSIIVDLSSLNVSLPISIELPDPGPAGLDSDYDNLVIIHEYAHGLSQRLTGGPMLTDCLTQTEQAGEGWSDFFGLVFTTDSTNTPEEPRGIATWLNEEETDGNGIRPFPFSRDFGIDPITYDNFGQVSVPHGIGSIFGSALWDLYWNMSDLYGFDSDLYQGTGGNNLAVQLVVDGMKLQPCNPNFLESRDAIVLADSILTGGENRCLIWETFARRGLGVNATPEGGANFEVPFTCRPFVQVTKTGTVDEELAGQDLQYFLDIRNGRSEPVADVVVYDTLPAGTSLVVGSSDCSITETDGVLAISLGTMAAEAIVACSYSISTDPDLFSELDFEDDTRNFSDWERDNPILDEQWSFRNGFDFSGNRAFAANNIDTISDQILTMEDAYQLGDVRPGIVLDHFYRTDEGDDGGVIEISTDDGISWTDVGAENIVENGYNPVPLSTGGGNPLSGRLAFHGRLDTFVRTAVDLSDYAGQTARIRFRFGSDLGGDGTGWVIDQIDYYDQLFVAVNKAEVTTDSVAVSSEVGVLMFPDPNSVSELENQLDLSIYPNPADEQFFIQVPSTTSITNAKLRVMDLNGRILFSQQMNQLSGRQSVPFGDIPAAVYLIDIVADQGVFRQRISKQ